MGRQPGAQERERLALDTSSTYPPISGRPEKAPNFRAWDTPLNPQDCWRKGQRRGYWKAIYRDPGGLTWIALLLPLSLPSLFVSPIFPSLSLLFCIFLTLSLWDSPLSSIAASPFRSLRTPQASLLSPIVPGSSFPTPLFSFPATSFLLRSLLPACPCLTPGLSWFSPSCSCENKQRPRSWNLSRKYREKV